MSSGMIRNLHFALLFLACAFTSRALHAEIVQLDLPGLEKEFPYRYDASISFHLTTPVKDVTSVQLALAGVHTDGLWQGDMVEDRYFGPKGALVDIVLSDFDSQAHRYRYWMGQYHGSGTAPFDTTLALDPASGQSPTAFQDGRISVTHDLIVGWGKYTSDPSIRFTHAELIVTGTPVPEPSTLLLTLIAAPVLLSRQRVSRNKVRHICASPYLPPP